jgi:glycosyltransferase involved in cell wall biosynthesis
MAKPVYDVIMTCNYSPWSDYSGGGQKSVHMLATAMCRQGLRVAAVYSKSPWESIPVHPETAYDVHWAGFFAFKPSISSPLRFLNGILFWRKVRALASRHTVIHANGDEASLFWLLPAKARFVYTNRYPEFPAFMLRGPGRDWTRIGTWISVFLREPRFVAIALGLRRADAVAVTSEHSRGQVARAFGVDPASLAVVPNGIDPDFLEMPLENGAGEGVLFFGRLTRAKGADLVLEAYARLPADLRARHRLKFIGNGPIRKELEARARALGVEADFPGWASGRALAQAILEAKAVCLPSREESFGNAVVETLALGQGLVSTRAGSIPEVAGPWGRLVPSEDVAALAQALEAELRAAPEWPQRHRQREYVRSRYSWGRAALRYRALYDPRDPRPAGPPRERPARAKNPGTRAQEPERKEP